MHAWLPLSLRSSGKTLRDAPEGAVHAILSAVFRDRQNRTLGPGELKNRILGPGSELGYQACDLTALAAHGSVNSQLYALVNNILLRTLYYILLS